MPSVDVYLVRHGETNENAQGIIQGQLDTQLNDLGRAQAVRVAQALQSQVAFHHAHTSDLQRASDTAKAIVALQPGLQLVVDIGLRERYLGDLQGKPGQKNMRLLPANVESGFDLTQRCLRWWDATIVPLAKLKSSETINVLAVSHGAYINTLILSGLASRNYRKCRVGRGHLFNSSISIIRVDDGGRSGELTKYGDVSHLLRGLKEKEESQTNADVLGGEEKTAEEEVTQWKPL